MKNASGTTAVRDAKNAIDAYKNITNAINAADAAAKEAKDAAENALNVRQGFLYFIFACIFMTIIHFKYWVFFQLQNVQNQKLTERAKDLKDTGDDLLQNAREANQTLQGTWLFYKITLL